MREAFIKMLHYSVFEFKTYFSFRCYKYQNIRDTMNNSVTDIHRESKAKTFLNPPTATSKNNE